jgi:hypothetical protein
MARKARIVQLAAGLSTGEAPFALARQSEVASSRIATS